MDQSSNAACGARAACYRSEISTDVDAIAGGLAYRNWSQRYDQLSSGPFAGGLEEVALPPLTVIRESSNRILLETGLPPSGVFAIGAVLDLSGDAYFRGDILRRRCLMMIDPLSEFELRTSERFDIVAAAFSPELLCAQIGDPPIDHRELEGCLFKAGKTIDTPRAASLQRFLFQLLETAKQTPDLLLLPATVRNIAEEFHGLLNDCLNAGAAAPKPAVCENRDRLLRRVRAYLEVAPEPVVSVSDICRDVGVNRRTLNNATQEVLGISPLAYLKAFRLNGLRRALKARDAAHESIGDIAARWGFWHLSQMAQDYRRLFGELPSQTRAQAA